MSPHLSGCIGVSRAPLSLICFAGTPAQVVSGFAISLSTKALAPIRVSSATDTPSQHLGINHQFNSIANNGTVTMGLSNDNTT